VCKILYDKIFKAIAHKSFNRKHKTIKYDKLIGNEASDKSCDCLPVGHKDKALIIIFRRDENLRLFYSKFTATLKML